MKTKHAFSATTMMVLMVVFTQFISSCTVANTFGIKGSGTKASEKREIGSFRGLDVSGGFEVVLTQGTVESLVIEADDNLMQHIITEVRGGELNIYTRDNVSARTPMVAYLTFVNLEDIDISGAVSVKAKDKLTFNRLSIDGSGASELEFEADIRNLTAGFSGASTVKLRGNTQNMEIECSGASKLYLADMQVSTASLELSGASYGEVWVIERLDVESSGASDVRYKGNPQLTIDTSGASSVKKL